MALALWMFSCFVSVGVARSQGEVEWPGGCGDPHCNCGSSGELC